VYRNNVMRINATNVVIESGSQMTCDVNVGGALPGLWKLVVTPECGQAAAAVIDDAVKIVTQPAGAIAWTVTPGGDAASSGLHRGPFDPDSHVYQLVNAGSSPVEWSVTKGAAAAWLDLPAVRFGTIKVGGSKLVNVSLNAAARDLAPGEYVCPLIFSAPPCAAGGPKTITRSVHLLVYYGSDFNRSLMVDWGDWAILADSWRKTCGAPDWCGGTDLDRSGSVGVGDLAVFAEQWLGVGP
ncbi:MAG: hypothetical protein IH624_00660, partial [Phycisphaerae bacterium]|nr:hypothetical protein [Phycisphaerae bacterium]